MSKDSDHKAKVLNDFMDNLDSFDAKHMLLIMPVFVEYGEDRMFALLMNDARMQEWIKTNASDLWRMVTERQEALAQRPDAANDAK